MKKRIKKDNIFKLRILTDNLWNPTIYKCLKSTRTIDTEDTGELFLIKYPEQKEDFNADIFLSWLKKEKYVADEEYNISELTTTDIFEVNTRLFR